MPSRHTFPTPTEKEQLRILLLDYMQLLLSHANNLDVRCAPFVGAASICRKHIQLARTLRKRLEAHRD